MARTGNHTSGPTRSRAARRDAVRDDEMREGAVSDDAVRGGAVRDDAMPAAGQPRTLAALMALCAAVFVVDLLLPGGWAAGAPYLLAVLLAGRMGDRRATFTIATLASVLTLAGYAMSEAAWLAGVDRGLTLVAVWAAAAITTRQHRATSRVNTTVTSPHATVSTHDEDHGRDEGDETIDLFHHCDDLMCVLGADGELVRVNAAFAARFGAADDANDGAADGPHGNDTDTGAPIGQPLKIFVHDDDQPVLAWALSTLRMGEPLPPFDLRLCAVGSEPCWFNVSARMLPGGERIVAIGRDVSVYKRNEAALLRSEQRFKLAAEGSNDGIWDWDIAADQVYFSPRWKELLGYADPDVGQSTADWFDRVHPDDARRMQAELALHLAGNAEQFQVELRMQRKDHSWRWMLIRGLAVRDGDGKAIRMAGSISDIHERKQVEQKLQHAATHDALTGLANRSMLMDRLTQAIKRAKRNPNYRFALLFLDFDRFKIINDSLGHDVGDELLKQIARRLYDNLRETDTVSVMEGGNVSARLGGDEFVIILDDIAELEDVEIVAGRLQTALNVPYELGGESITSTASIGIVTNEGEYDRADEMLRDADTAMYHAKKTGKARHVIFNRSMHDEVVERLSLENDLRKAVDELAFELYYQPIVSLAHGQLVGFEALLRWPHPMHGLIAPDKFIPLAEEIGLIAPLGHWVMREAAMQLKGWQDRFPANPPLFMNVNLSRRQLLDPELTQQVARTLIDSGVAKESLKFEITESVIMEHDDVLPALQRLRELDVRLAMDDFGKGHSSLSCLHRFPIDVLKIDRAFIENLEGQFDYTAVVNAIVTLAHHLQMTVVAEGIETAEQLAQLQALDCDEAQGYYFARPMPACEAEMLLAEDTPLRRTA